MSEYRVALRDAFGLKPNDQLISDDEADRATNVALQSISNERDWDWLFDEAGGSFAAGESTFALPIGYGRSAYVYSNGVPLSPIRRSDVVLYNSATTKDARFYVVLGGTIRVAPNPPTGHAWTHGFYRVERKLLTNVDAPLMPPTFDNWVVAEAGLHLGVGRNMTDRVEQLREVIAQERRRLVDRQMRADTPPRIRRTKPSSWQNI
ncbi:MAG: hypothetical protein H0U41_06740 [Actinobacteria bacterium]|nr:hypothetical protein [Actinomycetota bacterium]